MVRVLILLGLAVLGGCEDKWTASDLDGDGVTPEAGDCDDLDPGVKPGATEIWYDGRDQDCDGNDGDQDGDGYVSDEYADDYSWEEFSAHVAVGDCDDTDASVNPEGVETWYDCVDQDCDGNDGDQDGDGYVLDSYAASCTTWAEIHGRGVSAGDCVDSDADDPGWVDEDDQPVDWSTLGFGPASINPGVSDTCYDGVDADCDGASDYDCDGDGDERRDECDDSDATVFFDESIYDAPYDCIDADCDGSDGDKDDDGYVPDSYTTTCPDWAEFNGHLGAGDCWDDPDYADPAYTPALNDLPDLGPSAVYPGAADIPYDAIDADCAGDSDFDVDGDGFDAGDQRDRSGNFAGEDCDDADAAIHPDAVERLADDVDQDCDGEEICYEDLDGDGYGTSNAVASRDLDCEDAGESYTQTDCDDADDSVSPGAEELPADDFDQDCDTAELCYEDLDGDGYGSEVTVLSADLDCGTSGESYTDVDCDDSDAAINPDGVDTCTVGLSDTTGLDDDCDGLVDEGDPIDGACWEVGDLLITEISISPSTSPGREGEWFEVLNRTGYAVDLMGMTFQDLNDGEFSIGEHLLAAADERVVLCFADNAVSQAAGCAYVYGGGVLHDESPVGATEDENFIFNPDSTYLRIKLRSQDQSNVNLDDVSYTSSGSFPAFNTGQSIEFSEAQRTSTSDPWTWNDYGSYWCAGVTEFYSDSATVFEYGTPGATNDCP
ncbi:MAG: hypothetical protein H6741_33535 [Alphaproteobacteria bacterium]|nr:hypothetical protein [Alphaproteobacteria bacterium]